MPKIYRLVEIYPSIQGEGARAGSATIFVRFSKCSHKCTWCDTEFEKVNHELTLAELVEVIDDLHIPSVTFTGGEPAMQVDRKLVEALQFQGIHCAIETNGYFDVSGLGLDWICVSPKNQQGGPIEPERWKQRSGDELKVVFPDGFNDEIFLNPGLAFTHLFIQPCEEGGVTSVTTGMNTSRAVEFVKSNPRWRLSIQTHKILGVP